MAILSRLKKVGSAIKKNVSSAIGAVKSVASTIKNVFTGGSSQTAGVGNAVPTSSTRTINVVEVPSSVGRPGTASYNAFVVSNPQGTKISSGGSSTKITVPPNYLGQQTKTISSGKQPVGSSSSSNINTFGGSGDLSYGPTQTITSQRLGSGSTSLSSGSIGVSSPVVLPSNTGSVNPKLDTTSLAGRTAGLYERQDDGTFVEVQEDKESEVERKAREQQELYEKFVGVEPSVEDDREVREANRQRQQIMEALRAPTSELNAVIAQQQRDLLQLRQTGSQEGVTEAVYGGQQAAVNYNAAIRALPLQAAISSLQGDLELATDYLTELRQVKSDQIKRQYEYRKNMFESISGIIKTEDQRAYEEKKIENDRAYKEEQDLVDLQASLSQMILQNAPKNLQQNLLNRVNNAQDKQGAIQAAGEYGIPANTQLTQLDNGDTVVVDKNTGRIVANVGGRKATPTTSVAGLTPEQASDPFIQKLIASSGGKPMTDTSIQKLDKALGVLGQLGVLQNNVKNVKTGPIVGAFRGANPWDTNAQVIKAQLNGIVPNLARGVYGEVGVLTDNDIKTYSQTLPNLKSTEDIRNAVLGITIDLVSKSVKRTLEVNAANQKDVSQFVDLYTEMLSTRDSIFSNISGYTSNTDTTVTPEIEALRDKYKY